MNSVIEINELSVDLSALYQQSLQCELDFVLAFRPTVHDDRIESQQLFNNKLAAIVNDTHPLARQKSVSLTELQKYSLALPTQGLQARNAFDRSIKGDARKYKVKAEMNNVGMLFKVIRESNYEWISP